MKKGVVIQIKPLSVNDAYRGRRFATPELIRFKQAVYYSLPSFYHIPAGKLKIAYEFGVSSKSSDVDNLVKAFQDVLCTKYEFNDNRIYELRAEKKMVAKGKEYIAFLLSPAEEKTGNG